MKMQYAAINDLESVAAEIMKLGSGRLAIVFDPKLGWSVTDEIEVAGNDGVEQVVSLKLKTYEDWHRPHIANAMNALGGVRFIGDSAMEKLFRKASPSKTGEVVAGKEPRDGIKKSHSAVTPSDPPMMKTDAFGLTVRATKTKATQAGERAKKQKGNEA